MNKYEMLYEDKIEIGSHTLYRIRALKDFGNVKAVMKVKERLESLGVKV